MKALYLTQEIQILFQPCPDIESKKQYEGFSYRKESYEDHIRRVLEAFQDGSLKN